MNAEIAPVLKEIMDLLKKHDMAGVVFVCNKTHLDFSMEISPSWSCASLETDAEGHIGIRVRSKLEDYPSKEAQTASLQATIGTFVTLFDALIDQANNVEKLLMVLSESVEIEPKSTKMSGTEIDS